ncbi:hypothetical protein MKX01_013061 [Papaver californicum]|nr:hypothetical protein MKX01_013061 [Papaver californicum]
MIDPYRRPKSFKPLIMIYVAAFYTGVIGSAITEQLYKEKYWEEHQEKQFLSCSQSSTMVLGRYIGRTTCLNNEGKLNHMEQSGCCKPPSVCGYGYVNPILWLNPTNPTADQDCYAWNNDQLQLCYGCNSCKAGLLGNAKAQDLFNRYKHGMV